MSGILFFNFASCEPLKDERLIELRWYMIVYMINVYATMTNIIHYDYCLID